MATIEDVQDKFYKSLNGIFKMLFSSKYRLAVEHYPKLFYDTVHLRLSIITYYGSLYPPSSDYCIAECIINEYKKEAIAKERLLRGTLEDLERKCEKGKLEYSHISEFAYKNMRLGDTLQKKFPPEYDYNTNCLFKEIAYTSKAIKEIANNKDIRIKLINGEANFYIVEGKNALDSVSIGHKLNHNIPILRKAVNDGYIDQGDAHLAIIKGRSKIKKG